MDGKDSVFSIVYNQECRCKLAVTETWDLERYPSRFVGFDEVSAAESKNDDAWIIMACLSTYLGTLSKTDSISFPLPTSAS